MENFNGRLRDECLNETVFISLPPARPPGRSCGPGGMATGLRPCPARSASGGTNARLDQRASVLAWRKAASVAFDGGLRPA